MATDNEQADTLNETIEPGDLSKLLIEYRESASLDIDQVSEALCLTNSSITALENESFDLLPEAPYVRGYLRNYARMADKDPSHIIDVYNKLRGVSSSNDQTMELSAGGSYETINNPLITPQRFRMGLLALLLLLLAMLTMNSGVRNWASNLWANFSKSSNTPETVKTDTESHTLPTLTGELPGNLPISTEEETATEEKTSEETEQTPSAPGEETANEADQTASEQEGAESSEADDNANTNATAEADASDENNAAATTAEAADEEKKEETPEGDTHLKFVFTDEVWLRIKDTEGKTLYEALHKPGTEKELSLTSPLKLKVGNAPAMSLFVNGEAMDTAEFTKGSVAKFGIE